MSDNPPACAHSRVVLKHRETPMLMQGLNGHLRTVMMRSDYWECADGCGTQFMPLSPAVPGRTPDGQQQRPRSDIPRSINFPLGTWIDREKSEDSPPTVEPAPLPVTQAAGPVKPEPTAAPKG